MSRALQINSSLQGWMARNTKPVPLAEKGWVITMKKISIILLSAVLVFSMAACNGGKEKADNQTEKQTESVKPTEEVAMATEAVTEVTTEAGSDETEKDIAEAKDSEEKTDKEDNRSADNETASKQEEKPKQNDEPEQKAPVNDNEEAGGNQSNAGNGGQTTDSPKDNVSNPQPASVAYSPQNVVSLATAKCQAGGMITTQQNLQNHLNDGSITQKEYNEYYPYDGSRRRTQTPCASGRREEGQSACQIRHDRSGCLQALSGTRFAFPNLRSLPEKRLLVLSQCKRRRAAAHDYKTPGAV